MLERRIERLDGLSELRSRGHPLEIAQRALRSREHLVDIGSGCCRDLIAPGHPVFFWIFIVLFVISLVASMVRRG